MICNDNTLTIFSYYVCPGNCKTIKDFNWSKAIPIDDPDFEKMIEFAMKIRVLFNDYGKTSYTIYRKKNNYGKYFWQAQKRVNCKLRQIYIGYHIPDRAKLDSIASIFSMTDTEYYGYKRSQSKSQIER